MTHRPFVAADVASGSGAGGEQSPRLRDPSYPFVWAGLYEGGVGAHVLEMMPGPGAAMSLVLFRSGSDTGVFFTELAEHASRLFSTSAVERGEGQIILPAAWHQRLVLDQERRMRFPILLPKAGRYVLFTKRYPAEFAMRITGLKLLSERQFAAAPLE